MEIKHGPGHVPLGGNGRFEYLERLFVTAVAVFLCGVRQIAKQGSPAVQLGAAGDREEGVTVFTNIGELRIVFAKTTTSATKVLCQPAFIVNLFYRNAITGLKGFLTIKGVASVSVNLLEKECVHAIGKAGRNRQKTCQ